MHGYLARECQPPLAALAHDHRLHRPVHDEVAGRASLPGVNTQCPHGSSTIEVAAVAVSISSRAKPAKNDGMPELPALIDEALASSPDARMAAERVAQLEAQARVAGASLFPALNLSAGTSRRDPRPEGRPTETSESSSVTLSASYELDFSRRQLRRRERPDTPGRTRQAPGPVRHPHKPWHL